MKCVLPYIAIVVMVLSLWGCSDNDDPQYTRDTPPWVSTTRPKPLVYDPASEVPSAVAYRLGHQLWEEKGKGRWADVTRQVFEEGWSVPTPLGYLTAPKREYVVWGGEHIVQAIVNESIRSLRSWDPQRLRSALAWDGTEPADPVLDAAEMVLRQSDARERLPTDNCIFLVLYIKRANDASSISFRVHLATAVLDEGQYKVLYSPRKNAKELIERRGHDYRRHHDFV